jgi:hypothetical protein
MVTVADQVGKKIEDLGLDGHERRTPPQLATIHVERTFLEQVTQDSFRSSRRAPRQPYHMPPEGKMEGTLRQN